MLIQPKPYLDRLRKRRHAFGEERRRNITKMVLDYGTPFPKSVEYADIDREFFNWVDKKLDVAYNGAKLPTYKLFSTQRISEYSQTWSNLDDTGNIVMNFKTITRDNNPQHGDSQGGMWNIPGNRHYPMFYVPVLQENGEEAYDLYSIKQPLSVNFMYTVSIVCNKYELLNEFNTMIHHEFNAMECYIAPNDHFMPMTLENITDESEYTIDDRKYYSQSFQIKLMGYIIRKEDYIVTHVPSRLVVRMLDSDNGKKYKKVAKDDTWLGRLENANTNNKKEEMQPTSGTQLPQDERYREGWLDELPLCPLPDTTELRPHPTVIVEEDYQDTCCQGEEDDRYYNRIIKFSAEFPYCDEHITEFISEYEIEVYTIETTNVHDFVIKINGEVVDFDNDVNIMIGDVINVNISREDEYGDSKIVIVGGDKNEVIDTEYNPESALDEVDDEIEIDVRKNKNEQIN